MYFYTENSALPDEKKLIIAKYSAKSEELIGKGGPEFASMSSSYKEKHNDLCSSHSCTLLMMYYKNTKIDICPKTLCNSTILDSVLAE